MKIIKIKKKNGKLRTIYVPNRGEKKVFRKLVPDLNQRVKQELSDAVHGFIPGKSPVTNALAHVNKQFTTCFDLKDFFDTVKPEMVDGIPAKCFVDGAARQGLPTSPAVANLAAAKLDKAIIDFLKGSGVVYTRYADDLSFSYNDAKLTNKLHQAIPQIVRDYGFVINPSKTRSQWAKQGRRIITGVAVDSTIHPTRKQLRRLRAALHQNQTAKANGLSCWIDYLREQGWTQTDLEKLVSQIFGKRVFAERDKATFDGEGGFSLN